MWFADSQPTETRYVSIGKSLSNSSIYTERDDQKWSCYGGLTSVEMVAGLLSLRYDPLAAGKLGGVELIRVDCRGMLEETRERVEHVLRVILSDSAIPLTIA